jgi:hypothetical protein
MQGSVAREIAVGPDVLFRIDAAGKFESIAVRDGRPHRTPVVRIDGAGEPHLRFSMNGLPIVYWEDAEGRAAAVQVI